MVTVKRGLRRKHRAVTAVVHKSIDEFPAQVNLGFDGLGYIVTVDTTPEEARSVVNRIRRVNPTDVDKFFSAGEAKTA